MDKYRKNVTKALNEFQNLGLIKSYTQTGDRIEIQYPDGVEGVGANMSVAVAIGFIEGVLLGYKLGGQ